MLYIMVNLLFVGFVLGETGNCTYFPHLRNSSKINFGFIKKMSYYLDLKFFLQNFIKKFQINCKSIFICFEV